MYIRHHAGGRGGVGDNLIVRLIIKVLICSFNASNLSYDVFFVPGQSKDNTAKENSASPDKVFPKMVIKL